MLHLPSLVSSRKYIKILPRCAFQQVSTAKIPVCHALLPLFHHLRSDLLFEGLHASQFVREHHEHADVAHEGELDDAAVQLGVSSSQEGALGLHHGHLHRLLLVQPETSLHRHFHWELVLPSAWSDNAQHR